METDPVLRLIRRIARFEAYQMMKNRPRMPADLWRRSESTDAEIVSSSKKRPAERKKSQAENGRPRKVPR